MASSTVDFPEPVGPTRAKKSASVKSIVVGSRKTVYPRRSRRSGRTTGPPPGKASSRHLRIEPVEQRGDLRISVALAGQVVGEQIPGGPSGALGPGRCLDVVQHRRIDAHLQGSGQQILYRLAQP